MALSYQLFRGTAPLSIAIIRIVTGSTSTWWDSAIVNHHSIKGPQHYYTLPIPKVTDLNWYQQGTGERMGICMRDAIWLYKYDIKQFVWQSLQALITRYNILNFMSSSNFFLRLQVRFCPRVKSLFVNLPACNVYLLCHNTHIISHTR
jgi:hypothetical protein